MEVDCPVCREKDRHIAFLEKLLADLTEPWKTSKQTFVPTYINDAGEVIEMKPEEEMVEMAMEVENG